MESYLLRIFCILTGGWILYPMAISGTEAIRIAFLEEKKNGTGVDLIMYYTENQTERTLAENVRVGQTKGILSSSEKSGTICWVGRIEDKEYNGEIHCYRLDLSSLFVLSLPRLNPNSNFVRKAKNLSTTHDQNIFIEMDVFGNSVYWRDPFNGHIWATSLDNNASRIVSYYPPIVSGEPTYLRDQSWLYFTLDTFNGYCFGESARKRTIFLAPHRFPMYMHWLQGVGPDEDDVGAVRLFQQRYEAGAMTVDTRTKRAYGLWFHRRSNPNLRHEIVQTSYQDLTNLNETLVLEIPNVNISSSQLKHFDGNLYWSGSTNGSLLSFNLDSRTLKLLPRAEGGVFPSFYTLYEDGIVEHVNPCIELQCSHLCLPSYSKGYSCACPSGMSLVSANECRPGDIVALMIEKLENVYHFYKTHDSSDNYTFCRIIKENRRNNSDEDSIDGAEDCVPETTKELRKRINSIRKVYDNDFMKYNRMYDIQFQLDPWGLGFFHFFHKDACIKFYTFNTRAVSSILCLSNRLIYFSIDFLNGRIFSVEESANKFFIAQREYKSNQLLSRISLNEQPAGLAVDDVRKNIFWLLSPSTLISSNYDGTDRQTLSETEYVLPSDEPNLRFYGNQLFWFQNRSPNHSLGIVSYDLDTKLKTHITNKYFEYAILPPLNFATHPCSKSNCSHSCRPLSDVSYNCFCPDFMTDVSGNCIATTASCTHQVGRKTLLESFPLIELKENTSGRIFTNSVGPTILEADLKDLIFASRPSHNAICWVFKGSGIVKCRGDTRQILEVCAINANSSILSFDLSGNEIFFNDGYFGNMSLKSLKTNSVYVFPEFSVTHLVSWSLDTQRKIFFWSDKTNRIKFKVLFEKYMDQVETYSLGATKVVAITLDVYSRNLYLVQGRTIKRISYTDLFIGSKQMTTLRILKEAHTFLDFQYYSKSLYYLTDNAQFDGAKWPSGIVHFDIHSYAYSFAPSAEKLSNLRFPQSATEILLADPCDNTQCSHFCFPSVPLTADLSFAHQCACPRGLTLVQERTCEEANTSSTVLIVWSTVGSVAFLGLVSGLIAALAFKTRRNRVLANIIKEIKDGKPISPQETEINDGETAQNLPLRCIIPPNELEINKNKILGEGAFGIVLRGVYLNSVVAVKTLKHSARVDLLSEFAKEVKVMQYVGYHPHIVQFLGVEISNFTSGSFYAVLEFAPLGMLKQYLRQRAPKFQNKHYEEVVEEETENSLTAGIQLSPTCAIRTDDGSDSSTSIPIDTLVNWAEQIAQAMDYLSSKSVIHGDLAARNVLVFENQVVKVSDFGLSRKLYHYTTYRKKSGKALPWRWMAIEALKFLKFSTKTDVWAYGVTLWEIFTYGQVPFLEHDWNAAFKEKILNGLVLTKPDCTPEFIYNDIMKPSWRLDPEQRPSFASILQAFKSSRVSSRSVQYEFM